MLLNKATNPLESCEIKFDQQEGVFSGYASVFGGVDSYGDTIVRGAYSDTLANRQRPPLMLFGHNAGRVIGKWTALAEDEKGLVVTGELTPGHTDAKNAYASLKHGAITGLSIGFRVPDGGAEEKDGVRLLKKIDLVEISLVSMPADDLARVDNVRAEIETLQNIRDVELWLRDAAAFSRTQAKAFLAQLREILQRDADDHAAKLEALEAEARKSKDGEWLTAVINSQLRKFK